MGACGPPPRLAPPGKSGLIGDRTVSLIGEIMFVFLGGMIRGGSTPGAASPHSGRFRGVTGGLEGPKGGDSESPLGPPRKKPPRQGNFASLCKRDSSSPWPPHKKPPLKTHKNSSGSPAYTPSARTSARPARGRFASGACPDRRAGPPRPNNRRRIRRSNGGNPSEF